MENRSTTVVASIVMLIAALLARFGIPIGESQIMEVVDLVVKLTALMAEIITPLVLWIHRVRKGDVTPLGKRIQKEE